MSLVVWALAALISIFGALCYVELGTSIRASGADFAYLCYLKWYPLAFGFMCVGCVVLFPVAIAVQAQTFSEYLIQGFRIEICDPTAAFFAKKLLGFALICKFHTFFSCDFGKRQHSTIYTEFHRNYVLFSMDIV
ncbi:unnamed protein product [Toxocara canis]|uniref:Aa_trans domain-containing protein n=1 Tax=Toxocara canis TaxID=6265 RepID=A0A183VG89_TOXCA|nr:unnamed protein product [Toxocara canis]